MAGPIELFFRSSSRIALHSAAVKFSPIQLPLGVFVHGMGLSPANRKLVYHGLQKQDDRAPL